MRWLNRARHSGDRRVDPNGDAAQRGADPKHGLTVAANSRLSSQLAVSGD